MRGQPWTMFELARLVMLKDQRRLTYAKVSLELPGRTPGACMLAYYKIQKDRQCTEAKHLVKAMPKWNPPKPFRIIAPAPASPREMPPPSGAVVSTHTLRVDAELRARIDALGVTGGMLGDPLPGRSALDRKRAGIVEPELVDRRNCKVPPRPTLATEPLS